MGYIKDEAGYKLLPSRVTGEPIDPDRAVKLYGGRLAQQVLDQSDGVVSTARRVLLAALMTLEAEESESK